jgi:hypothetical protein
MNSFALCKRLYLKRLRRTLVSAALVVSASLVAFFAPGCGDDDSAGRPDPAVPFAEPASKPQSASKTEPQQVAASSQAGTKVIETGPFEKVFDGIRFSVPAGWEELENPTPEFVDARFQIPTPQGSVKLTFSSNAGGADLNIQRWIGQFQLPPGKKAVVDELNVDGTASKWVDLQGEFLGGAMALGPASGPVERMLGVAIPLGPRDFYLKLTGTNAAVGNVRDAFREFVRTARISTPSKR